jgi:DeoR family glycerol-3-phosphate regulon repressor
MAITEQRLRLILSELQHHNRVSVNALSDSLAVSTETIRRDLKELEARGEARRVYGGAVLDRKVERPFVERRRVQAREKARIGAAAAALVEEGMTIFVDTGTTTLAFANQIAERSGIGVHTNSIDIADLLAHNPASTVTVVGGTLVPLFKALFGPDTLRAVARNSYDLAIMSIGTVHADHGFMDRGEDEAELRRVVRGRAKRTVMLADSSKFGRLGRITTFALTDVDVLVTDAPPKGAFAERLDGSRVQVILA